MRRATGSNRSQPATERVSIQLTLDGHFFSVPAAEALTAGGIVELLTPLTLLVPRALYTGENAAALFAADGLPLPAAARVLEATGAEADVVALLGISAEAWQQLETLCGDREIRCTTPLLTTVEATSPTVWICDTGGMLYIKVFDAGLQLAEAVAVGSEADRLYLLQRLAERIEPKRFVLRLEDRAGNRRHYRNYFKKIVCE